MEDFFAYVRGNSSVNNHGRGADVYRFLVNLGVDDVIRSYYPQIVEGLGEEQFNELVNEFIRQSEWRSPYVNDLKEEFERFLGIESVSSSDVSNSGVGEI